MITTLPEKGLTFVATAENLIIERKKIIFVMSDLHFIKDELLDIYASISHLSEDSLLHGLHEQFYTAFERLDRLVAMDVDDQDAEEIRQDLEFQPVMEHISRLKRVNGLRLEIENVQRIINASAPWEVVRQFVYYPNYLELARMEFAGADLASGDRVVFLGSGPLPLTLISLCTQYGIQGIGIERCAEYADLSRQLITALKLTAHICIIDGDHFSLPLPEACALIMIGADALPKEEIFSYLAGNLADNTKLSYRIYEKGLRRLLDVQSVFRLPPEFREYRRIRPKPPVNNTSVFVVKHSSAMA